MTQQEWRVTTYWTSGGSTVSDGLTYTDALDTAFAHRAHGHTCKIEVRDIGPWNTYLWAARATA